MQRVPLTDLAAEHEPLTAALSDAFERVTRSARFILGEEVERFERLAADYLGVEHAVGVSSCSDAVVMALLALGIGPGDEVITTAFSFFATAEAIARVGARPVFADVDPETLNLSPERANRLVGPRTRAILTVDLYGVPADPEHFADIARRHGVAYVSDSAQAFGSRIRGRAAGSWGALGCFSFFPTKVLGAFGDGGLVVTNDGALVRRLRSLRVHGAVERGQHHHIGGNFRLDALQGAILAAKLPHVDRWIARRCAHAAAYDAALRELRALRLLRRPVGWNGAIYTVRVSPEHRDPLRAFLLARGVETAVYYPAPQHRQPAFVALGASTTELAECERAAQEVLSLPLYPALGDAARTWVIECVRGYFAGC